ncbi:HAD domain-containing protein [Burkholderia glumae]|uniref:HAD domain-containing protein n=1 Tax=Burkholderia glumae TaxID=337 RepID=UPI0034608C67
METYSASRPEEILWEAERRKATHWLAIDDHPSVASVAIRDPRFIACAPDTGLSAVLMQQALHNALVQRYGLSRMDRAAGSAFRISGPGPTRRTARMLRPG